jgi:glyoxylase-like metal-dependent hydrolase (beta-lactamase superfamily II)
MNTYYRFKLGDFDCACISDGDVNYPVSSYFKNVPAERAQAILREFGLPTTHVYSPYTLLFVDTGKHKVLVDTGVGLLGKQVKEMFREVDNSRLEAGIALQSLRNAGINPAEIDTVIITHAHPDHIGGNLAADGKLSFPNAQYYLSQTEWDFWFSDEQTIGVPASFVQIARTNLNPIRDRVTYVEPNAEIVPGITAIPAHGHTPGHLALSVASRGAELLHISDAVIHPVHLRHPDILLPYDILPEQTLASRRAICDRAVGSGALVFGHHFPPYPNLGHITQQGDVWRWEPVSFAERKSDIV